MTLSHSTQWLPVRIEAMAEADLDAVLDIEYLSFTSPWPRDIFLGELRGSDIAQLYVARIIEGVNQGQVAGYCCSWIIADEAHITSFAVHPQFRRQHIGQQLMAGVLAHAMKEGCRQAVLEVRASNHGAQRLYSQFGFAPVAVRKRYYADNNEDAIIMFLDDLAAQVAHPQEPVP